MTILFIMLIIIAKPKEQPVLTSLPIKSFAEKVQTNPYLTGINNSSKQSSQSSDAK